MKIFWSWQSDTPGKTGRHFVRDALLAAVETLKQPPDIEEPAEREARAGLHVDQDRAGIPGSPDLAATILEKIGRAAVFVADVTPVAATPDGAKKVMNPNVAIELGYALRALTDRALIMVMNEHYGAREDLPFDLRHKAGPLLYRLAPGADKQTIEAQKKRLAGELVRALRPYLSVSEHTTAERGFPETPSTGNPAVYFGIGEHLTSVGEPDEDEVHFSYADTNGFYLRLIPTRAPDEPIALSKLLKLVKSAHKLQPLLDYHSTPLRGQNRYGAMVIEPRRNHHPQINASTQVFETGEIWGFNAQLLKQRDDRQRVMIPSEQVEGAFAGTLGSYMDFAEQQLKLEPPFAIEAGATGLEGAYIAVSGEQPRGPIRKSQLMLRKVVNNTSEEICIAFLLQFFERLFDLTGYARPKGLHKFPPS